MIQRTVDIYNRLNSIVDRAEWERLEDVMKENVLRQRRRNLNKTTAQDLPSKEYTKKNQIK